MAKFGFLSRVKQGFNRLTSFLRGGSSQKPSSAPQSYPSYPSSLFQQPSGSSSGHLTIHIGVVEQPYADEHGVTTGDVAQWLENKYHLMEVFVEDTGGAEAISRALEQSAGEAIENMMLGGGGVGITLTAQAETDMETEFRHYLSQQRFDGLIPGVPTQAALKGISHRLKRPYAKDNPERPSFIDTGLFQASFKVWTET